MYNQRDIDKIKNEILANIYEEEARVEAWKKVTRNRKKDGTDFSSRSKNFNNADVDYNNVIHPKITVHYHVKEHGYNEDWINLYVFDDKEISGREIIKYSGLRPYYIMTIDEIFEVIQERIIRCENNIEELKQQRNSVEEVFIPFADTIDEAVQEMKEKAKGTNTLYWKCLKYMRDYY